MEITNSKLSNYILYSNKNLDKLCRSLINESSNALMLELFDDKMLLADHNSGALYLADYKFDGKSLVVENFDNLDVINDESSLKEEIGKYFDDDGYDTAKIVEAYNEDSESNNTDLNDSIVESLASKDTNDKANYSEIIGINEDNEELKSMSFFKNYKQHLTESPTSTIKVFDWVNPVRVSLIDEDENKTLVGNAGTKAQNLSKNKDFRKLFAEAASDMMNGNSETMQNLLNENSSILALDNIQMKEFVGMSVIGDKELMSNRKEIVENVNKIVSEDENLSSVKNLLSEEEDDKASEDDKKLDTSSKDIEALKDALDKALDKVTDEKLLAKINSLKDALDASEDEGTTDVGTVKECVELLSF